MSITLLEKMTADVVSLAKVPDVDLQSAAEWLYSFDVQNSEGALRQRSMAYFSVVVQQMSYSWISTTMVREHGTFGRRTSIPLEMVFANRERRHGVSIVYVSTVLQGVVA